MLVFSALCGCPSTRRFPVRALQSSNSCGVTSIQGRCYVSVPSRNAACALRNSCLERSPHADRWISSIFVRSVSARQVRFSSGFHNEPSNPGPPDDEPAFLTAIRQTRVERGLRPFNPATYLSPAHAEEVRHTVVASAESLAGATSDLTEHDRHLMLYDVRTVEAHVTNQQLWEEGIRAYGASTDDILRWRNALASSSITDAVPHLMPSLRTSFTFAYQDLSVALPPPWVVTYLFLHRVRTPRDVALSSRLLVAAKPVLSLSMRWKLCLIHLRQICIHNLTPLLPDCMTYMLEVDDYQYPYYGRISPMTAGRQRINRIITALQWLQPHPIATHQLLRALEAHRDAGLTLPPICFGMLCLKPYLINNAVAQHMTARANDIGLEFNTFERRTLLAVAAKVGRPAKARKHLEALVTADLGKRGLSRLSARLAAFMSSHHKLRRDNAVLELIDDVRQSLPDSLRKESVTALIVSLLSRHRHVSLERIFGQDTVDKDEIQNEMMYIIRSNPKAIHHAMRNVLARKRPEVALVLYKSALASGLNLDVYLLSELLRTLGYLNRLADAFALVCKTGGIALPADMEARVNSLLPPGGIDPTLRPDHVCFNILMDSMNHLERFDMVWQTWNVMQRDFGIRPRVDTLNLLITSANYARVGSNLATGFEALRNRFGPRSSNADDRMAPEQILNALRGPKRVTDFWEFLPPVQVAEDILLEILGDNFPRLQYVQSPINEEKDRSPAPATSDPSISTVEQTDASDPFFHLTMDCSMPSEGRWAHLHPDNRTFGKYIAMLNDLGRTEDIPLILAWMRALHLTPPKGLLAQALMYYDAEGDRPSPSIIDPQDTDYGKLRKWLVDWLGPGKVPKQTEIRGRRTRRVRMLESRRLRDPMR